MRVRTGRFTELPGRSRVMDLHPQFFDRYETLLLQPLVGHTGLGGQSSGRGPRAVSVQARSDGGTQEGAEFEQLPNFGAAPSPLFPVAHPRPPPDPTVYLRDVAALFGDTEIAHPAPEVNVMHSDGNSAALHSRRSWPSSVLGSHRIYSYL